MGFRVLLLGLLFGCVVETGEPTVTEPTAGSCDTVPDAGAPTSWRHTTSGWIANADAHHRGTDLIATTDDATQTVSGKLTYSDLDKDLEDEDVELFACIDARWQPLGDARTDDDGRFALTLTGDERLPAGVRDLYVSVAGDRTGATFLAFVAAPGAPIVVADVDGTLTASENAYPIALALGGDVAVQPDAPATLASALARGVSVVYITARGDRFKQDTRDWLAAKGFPRGPIRMPTAIITMPGEDTVEFKSAALASVAGFEVLAGFGNRASDIAAYTNAGLTPERIFIKLPEFTEELTSDLSAGKATGFDLYDVVRTDQLPALMP